ncbi:hypothetical protein RZS08_30145, partial [Arthrospira platensis SPKY1]|nr:hypothetical protein [Arthrospira platensis SPKY1]
HPAYVADHADHPVPTRVADEVAEFGRGSARRVRPGERKKGMVIARDLVARRQRDVASLEVFDTVEGAPDLAGVGGDQHPLVPVENQQETAIHLYPRQPLHGQGARRGAGDQPALREPGELIERGADHVLEVAGPLLARLHNGNLILQQSAKP